MEQGDLFDETIVKKILRIEKWLFRMQKELWFLKEVHLRTKKDTPGPKASKVEQMNFFGT